MSVQSCVQHVSSASGAMVASSMLTTLPNGALVGMDRVATLTAAAAGLVPLLMFLVEARVRNVERGNVEDRGTLHDSIPAEE